MIALKIPKEQFELLQNDEDYYLSIKDDWFVDYKGKCI